MKKKIEAYKYTFIYCIFDEDEEKLFKKLFLKYKDDLDGTFRICGDGCSDGGEYQLFCDEMIAILENNLDEATEDKTQIATFIQLLNKIEDTCNKNNIERVFLDGFNVVSVYR